MVHFAVGQNTLVPNNAFATVLLPTLPLPATTSLSALAHDAVTVDNIGSSCKVSGTPHFSYHSAKVVDSVWGKDLHVIQLACHLRVNQSGRQPLVRDLHVIQLACHPRGTWLLLDQLPLLVSCSDLSRGNNISICVGNSESRRIDVYYILFVPNRGTPNNTGFLCVFPSWRECPQRKHQPIFRPNLTSTDDTVVPLEKDDTPPASPPAPASAMATRDLVLGKRSDRPKIGT